MRVTVVGCAGSFPGPDSPASCYLLEAEGFRLVIDLGNGALGVLQRYAGLFDIDAICVSHLHADHCADLGTYWVVRQYPDDGPKPPIPVHGPRGTADRVAGLGSAAVPAVQARGYDDLSGETLARFADAHVRALEPESLRAALTASVAALVREGAEAQLPHAGVVAERLAEL